MKEIKVGQIAIQVRLWVQRNQNIQERHWNLIESAIKQWKKDMVLI